jgi:hypothetical protein
MTTDQAFYQTICHYAQGDLDAAVATACSIADRGELYAQAAHWLGKVAQGDPSRAYLDADAFAAFIRGGGNLAMYRALDRMVAAAWDEHRPATILDIGTGDGRVIAGALDCTHLQPLPAFELVEPARNLLPKALERLCQRTPAPRVRSFNSSIQAYMDQAPPTAAWDVCQATWSLQNLSATERGPLFRWLSQRCKIVLLAEFDVQTESLPLLSPERVRLIHDKYVAGLAEYTGHTQPALEEQVKQGFLMPIMFGYFRSGAGRSTCEQAIAEWSAEFEAAGFRNVQRQLIYNYWWADAYLLTAYV